MALRPSLRAALLGGLLTSVTACAHSKIPQTDIDDTDDNRSVMAFIESYEAAVESLDAEAVLALVSPEFYEDNGNSDRSDDYGYEGLAEKLRTGFERTKVIQLQLRIDAIEVADNSAFAEMYYEYRAQVEYPSGARWDTNTDSFRVQLRRPDPKGDWRIISGI